MIPSQRRQQLLDLLDTHNELAIAELATYLEVSHMTVRRDIQRLEQAGRVLAVSGGVRRVAALHREPAWPHKAATNTAAKRAIARHAAALVKEGQTIYLDAGTTLYEMAALLTGHRQLCVITNNFQISALLAGYPQIELHHAGGRVDPDNHATVGPAVAAYLSGVNLDQAFFSSSSWDLERGMTTPDEAKLVVKQQLLRSAARRVLLADSAKYGRFGRFRACSLEAFDLIVSDEALPSPARQALAERGIALSCVPVTEPSAAEHAAPPHTDPLLNR
ncbi:DeoR/GlpR transcriptional regulator [Salinicola endophyticus]|uniref:DeoR/GlpR transcriptional regulator n=1 Tax=Salinicola endophyticus TaxID=1949083 RepID=A0ABY8FJA9_9GAMM|nr:MULTISPECIES: DeoR/GlpR family DNA-binding transcription regulator [Salinicola]WFF41271.1 DeoR/GlpR transcriptional regulator [Salinicola endophyticus]